MTPENKEFIQKLKMMFNHEGNPTPVGRKILKKEDETPNNFKGKWEEFKEFKGLKVVNIGSIDKDFRYTPMYLTPGTVFTIENTNKENCREFTVLEIDKEETKRAQQLMKSRNMAGLILGADPRHLMKKQKIQIELARLKPFYRYDLAGIRTANVNFHSYAYKKVYLIEEYCNWIHEISPEDTLYKKYEWLIIGQDYGVI